MSAYLGRRGLAQLRERLSERDLDVIRSVAEHRFLTARQIETPHFVQHATELAGARGCRRPAVGPAASAHRRTVDDLPDAHAGRGPNARRTCAGSPPRPARATAPRR